MTSQGLKSYIKAAQNRNNPPNKPALPTIKMKASKNSLKSGFPIFILTPLPYSVSDFNTGQIGPECPFTIKPNPKEIIVSMAQNLIIKSYGCNIDCKDGFNSDRIVKQIAVIPTAYKNIKIQCISFNFFIFPPLYSVSGLSESLAI
jgi:hypothetical protein